MTTERFISHELSNVFVFVLDFNLMVPFQIDSVKVETWGESQVALGDTVTATITIIREHACEYRGFRRR